MKQRSELPRRPPFGTLAKAGALIAVAGLLGVIHSILADGVGNADVLPDVGCMQDTAGFGLTCTANDVQLVAARNITIVDDGCAFQGDAVTFRAELEVLLTAQPRHDIGIWFSQDGDPNGDGAISGTCTLATPAYAPDPPWLDLDGINDPLPGGGKPSGIRDTCGDIGRNRNPLFPVVTLTVACMDPDRDGKLNLPNCTSWRQSGANNLCTSPVDAHPGSPSKCRCDIGFNIDIDVPPARLVVTKTADPTSVNEPGGPVTYTITVTNTGIDPDNDVTLDSLNDDLYGDVTVVQGDIMATDCMAPHMIPADDGNIGGIDTYTCAFVANVSGNPDDVVTDVLTASAVGDRGNTVTGSDDAAVTTNDERPSITVLKTANPTEVLEPGGALTFTVQVTNNGVSSDPVTIAKLTDDVHGNLHGQGDCAVPQILAGEGGTYSCSFTAHVTGNALESQTDTVTASGDDDEGNPVSDSDSATVMILDVPSMIELIKTASPTSVDEPGGNVTYSFTVINTSPVDTVTINNLRDSILGDLTAFAGPICAVPQVLAPSGGTYSCTVIAPVDGNAFDAVTSTATALGVDDDGKPVMAADDATVDINNVPPAASLTKTPITVLVTYEIEVCNDSDAEALTLDALSDDIYGDVTQVQDGITETNCAVPQTLAPAGQMGECYTCWFDAVTMTSPTTDTVTGELNDDDASVPVRPSDTATVRFE